MSSKSLHELNQILKSGTIDPLEKFKAYVKLKSQKYPKNDLGKYFLHNYGFMSIFCQFCGIRSERIGWINKIFIYFDSIYDKNVPYLKDLKKEIIGSPIDISHSTLDDTLLARKIAKSYMYTIIIQGKEVTLPEGQSNSITSKDNIKIIKGKKTPYNIINKLETRSSNDRGIMIEYFKSYLEMKSRLIKPDEAFNEYLRTNYGENNLYSRYDFREVFKKVINLFSYDNPEKQLEEMLNYFGSIYNPNVPYIDLVKEELISLVYTNEISVRNITLDNTEFSKMIAKACYYPVKIAGESEFPFSN